MILILSEDHVGISAKRFSAIQLLIPAQGQLHSQKEIQNAIQNVCVSNSIPH